MESQLQTHNHTLHYECLYYNSYMESQLTSAKVRIKNECLYYNSYMESQPAAMHDM